MAQLPIDMQASTAAGLDVVHHHRPEVSRALGSDGALEHDAAITRALPCQVPTMHQILLARAEKDYPRDHPPPLRFIRSCSSSLAAPTLHKLEAAFGVPVLEVQLSETLQPDNESSDTNSTVSHLYVVSRADSLTTGAYVSPRDDGCCSHFRASSFYMKPACSSGTHGSSSSRSMQVSAQHGHPLCTLTAR